MNPRVVLFPLLLALLPACSLSVSPSRLRASDSIHSNDDIALSTDKTRLKMRALVDPLCGRIEASANQIIAASNDPDVKRSAIEWKSQGVPAMREALYQPDPLTALFDAWVLSNQMTLYFTDGPGAASLGSHTGAAVTTCLNLERTLNLTAASITKSGDVTNARAAARNWAVRHPITTTISARTSTLSRLASADFDEISASETLGDVTMTLDDLNRKLETYTDQLVRQARWEAELFSIDLTDRLQLNQAMPLAAGAVGSAASLADSVEVIASSVGQLTPVIERLAVVAETTPEIIAAERAAVISAISEDLNRTISFVREEREAALHHITSERLAALQTLNDTIASEHQALRVELTDLATTTVDHTFHRLVQLCIGILTAITLILLAALFIIRRMVAGLIPRKEPNPA